MPQMFALHKDVVEPPITSPVDRSMQQMNACLDQSLQIEQLCEEIDKARRECDGEITRAQSECKAQLDNAGRQHQEEITCAESDYKKNMAAADTARCSVIEFIRRQFNANDIPVPNAVGMLPPANINTNGMIVHVEQMTERLKTQRAELEGYSRDRPARYKPLVYVCGIISFFLIWSHWPLALLLMVVPASVYGKVSSAKQRMQRNIQALADEFRATTQSLDSGSHNALLWAQQTATQTRDIATADAKARLAIAEHSVMGARDGAISGAESRFTIAKRALENTIDGLEPELRCAIAELDAGTVNGRWSDPEWSAWTPAKCAPLSLRMGKLLPDMPRFYHYYPQASPVEIPAVLNYQSGDGIVIESDGNFDALRAMAQGLILRLLATIPPAGVRFVFIDPVSLGRNVAAFMSLEKHEPTLIGGKAWSDPQHIEKALAEVTEHMETVIQKYLREDFKSIEEYNEQARVKEAYRVIVVFDFPVNFTESSAKRLASIMRNGPRCGVFPLVIRDKAKPLPYGFHMGDLEQFARVLRLSPNQAAR
ncbi:MAG: FtsK/SpoIIIE domain-containing protein [Armatimonadota bacterium]|nr:FtsK/SpoIIIE domain-containing protein [Armatimonadota bacterium]